MFEFLTEHEQLSFQQLNKWWYKTGVQRIQMRISLRPPVYFLSSQNSGQLFSVQTQTSKYELEAHQIQGEPMSDFGWRMIQVGRRIYVIGGYQDPHRFVELELDSITGDFSQKLRA